MRFCWWILVSLFLLICLVVVTTVYLPLWIHRRFDINDDSLHVTYARACDSGECRCQDALDWHTLWQKEHPVKPFDIQCEHGKCHLHVTRTPPADVGQPIVLYSSGGWKGIKLGMVQNILNGCDHYGPLIAVNTIRQGLIPSGFTLVSFEFPTNGIGDLNFGQERDGQVLDHLWWKIRRLYPCSPIVLMAECMGALKLLNWIAMRQTRLRGHVSGVVLESPLIAAKQYVPCCHVLVSTVIFPSYVLENDACTWWFMNHRIRLGVPVLIGYIEHDETSCQRQVDPIAERFFDPVKIFKTNRKTFNGRPVRHGSLRFMTPYQKCVYEFLDNVK